MIDKIVVSRKSGLTLAALNLAVKLGLATGGWSRADDPEFMQSFGLEPVAKEPPSSALDRSIAASHGALYFIQGNANGASLQYEKFRRCVTRMDQPRLDIRINEKSGFGAAQTIAAWIAENQIRTLYLDGECDEQGQEAAVKGIADILEAAYFLAMATPGRYSPKGSRSGPEKRPRPGLQPETLEAALDYLEKELALKDKATIANMTLAELNGLDATLGSYILRHFDLSSKDSKLLAECRLISGKGDQSSEGAAATIIEKLWERLRATCRLRVVK